MEHIPDSHVHIQCFLASDVACVTDILSVITLTKPNTRKFKFNKIQENKYKQRELSTKIIKFIHNNKTGGKGPKLHIAYTTPEAKELKMEIQDR